MIITNEQREKLAEILKDNAEILELPTDEVNTMLSLCVEFLEGLDDD